MKLQKLIESLVEEELASTSLDEQFRDGTSIGLTSGDQKILVGLELALENEINRSVELEESVSTSESLLSEKSGAKGFAYEETVIAAIATAGASGMMTSGAGASKESPDADITLNGEIYPIEVKLDSKAQMGGSSVRYVKGAQSISLVKELEPQTMAILVEAVSSKKESLDRLLDFLSKQKPKVINERAQKFSTSVTKEAWTLASSKKLLVNVMVESSVDIIAKHYASKGVYYIQIGGAGLFYLKRNPANLPIPKLSGNVRIEIRSARSGSRKLSSGYQVVGGGIRVQARLLTKSISPYTLDDPKSITRMLEALAADKP